MVVVGFRNSSEGLVRCMYTLAAGETNVDFLYSLMIHPEGRSLMAMHLCDYDFDNDCVVNFLDVGFMANVFYSANSIADVNGDGIVNFLDFAKFPNEIFSNYLIENPSAVPNTCSSR